MNRCAYSSGKRRTHRVLVVVQTALLILAGLSAQSCSRFAAEYRIWRANQSYRQGLLHDALVVYLAARESDEPALSELAAYNTAVVYAQLQEYAAARELFDELAGNPGLSPELAARVWHNIGTLNFQASDYRGALQAYRRSLRYQPGQPLTMQAYALALERSRQPDQAGADRERSALIKGPGDNFGLFSVSGQVRHNLFKAGEADAAATILDH